MAMARCSILFGLLAVYWVAATIPTANSSHQIRTTRQVDNQGDNSNLDYYSNANAVVDPKRQQEDSNKEAVWILMNELFGNKNVDILDKYVSAENYIQHSPNMPDGLESIKAFANRFIKNLPKETADIRRISADGDLVWVHWKWNWQGKPNAFVDIFRFENGKIVEHWDVIQEIPEKSANDHPMF